MAKRLLDKVTPGIWRHKGNDIITDAMVIVAHLPVNHHLFDVATGRERVENARLITTAPEAIESFIRALKMIDLNAMHVPEGIIRIVDKNGVPMVEKNVGGVAETLNEFQLALAEASAFAEYITGEKIL